METRTIHDLYLKGLPTADNAPGWLVDERAAALSHFRKIGFPTVKSEAWKYTDLSTILKDPFIWEPPADAKIAVLAQLKALSFDVEGAHVLVFVNGRYVPQWSSMKALPKGVKLQSLAQTLEEDELSPGILGNILSHEGRGFTALNTAFFTDGLYLKVPAGKDVPQPIHAVYVSSNGGSEAATQTHVRNLIHLGENGTASVIEHYWGEDSGPYLMNTVTEVSLEQGSSLDHTKIQRESLRGYHVGTLAAGQSEASRLTSRVFSLGGALGRNEVETVLRGKRAECSLDGLYLARGRQHVDNRTVIDHQAPSCTSGEIYKGVVDGEGTGIFDGRVLVRENSQKTDARQVNKNLQLSKTAKVYSKPQLMIYADDVKCSHGSATGQLDNEALFYFQSRGIGKEEARRVLIYAFATEMVERVPLENLQTPLREMINEWMVIGREARP